MVLVSPHWEGIKREFADAFSKKWKEKTGRDLSFRWLDVGGTSDIIKFINTQYARTPDSIGVDLMFGGGVDPFFELEDSNKLFPFELPKEILSQIPANLAGVPLYDPKFRWYAAGMSTFGILYNKTIVSKLGMPVPTEWSDLAKPEYYSWVGSGDLRKSGSIHMMYEVILQAYGWEKGWHVINGLGANVRNFSGNASQVGKDLASGEIAYGLVIDTYAGELIRKFGDESLGYVVPKGLSPLVGDGIGILKGAPNLEIAKSFVEFVMSEEGQKIFYGKKGEPGGPKEFDLGKLSVLPKLYGQIASSSPIKENPFTWKLDFTYDSSLGGSRWGVVNDLIGIFVIDQHNQKKNEAASKDLGPPISEENMKEIVAAGNYKDQNIRGEYLSKWSSTFNSGASFSLITSPFLLIALLLACYFLSKFSKKGF